MARRRKKPDDPATEYAEKVVAGEIVAGRLVRLAGERHLRDIDEQSKSGLEWKPDVADRIYQLAANVRLPDRDQPFKLEPPLAFIAGSLIGWHGPDGWRRFRTAYIEMGKGNAKTPLAALLGIYGLMMDGEQAAEIYTAGVTRDQAKYLLEDAKNIINASPSLRSRLEVLQHNVAYLRTASYMRPVSSEGRNLDQKRVHMALIDEVHEHRTDQVVDKMRAGTKSRNQGLIVEITNAGNNRQSVCWRHHDYSGKILEGILKDDSWFAYVCQLDPCEPCRKEGKTTPTDNCPKCDDWRDPTNWIKANPMLGVSITEKYIREQVREAVGMPAKERLVRRLNMCAWLDGAVEHAIPMDKWDACETAIDLDSLKDRECFGGLDIGAMSDFTAFALLFPDESSEEIEVPIDWTKPDGDKVKRLRRGFAFLPFFWMPEVPRKRDARLQEIIDTWKRQGLIRVTPGDTVDYDQVVEDIVEIVKPYSLSRLGFDKGFQGMSVGLALQKHFADRVEEVPQGSYTMNAPFRESIELIKQKRFHHAGDPIARWMASNTAAEIKGGWMKPSKDKSVEKIDIITAACMAMALSMKYATPPTSYYDDGEIEMG